MTRTNENPLRIKINEDIELKQVEVSDTEDIFKTIDCQRDYLGKWLPFVAYSTKVEDTLDFVKSVVKTSKERKEYVFTIRKKDNFIGLIGLKETDSINKKTEIGYWLSEYEQGQGIMTQSVDSLCKFVFNNLKLNRIQIKCATGNNLSKRIPKRLGFKLEGIERDGELLSNGIFTDLEIYSKLKSE